MKVFTTVMKVIAALAVLAGIVYVIIAYRDKIVSCTKKVCAKLNFFRKDDCCCCDDDPDFEG